MGAKSAREQKLGAGWIDLAKIARNLGMSEDHVKAAWLPLATALR